jgi:hypothetical protein
VILLKSVDIYSFTPEYSMANIGRLRAERPVSRAGRRSDGIDLADSG